MLKLIDTITKALNRKALKEIKANRTNEVAAAYIERLTKGRKIDTVRVVNAWDNRANRWAK